MRSYPPVVAKSNGYAELSRIAEGKDAHLLVPVLGSGFVTQAVMTGARLAPKGPPGATRPPPVDWLSLLRGVAQEFECRRAASHIETDVPGQTTLLWEAMVAELAGRHGAGKAHVWEAKMRRSIARRLREDATTLALSRPFVDSFLRLGWDDVVTFNFDSVLLPLRERPAHRLAGAGRRASLAATRDRTTIWYPHGHQSDPDSIVLGAHAYGVRVAAMQAAFDAHARRRAPRAASQLDSFVATMLERPLLFVGLSLTREEWTIWWLLSQRSRFLARRHKRPAAFVFARRPASTEKMEAHGAFATLSRACDLLGVTLLEFGDFQAGWKKLRAALGWPA